MCRRLIALRRSGACHRATGYVAIGARSVTGLGSAGTVQTPEFRDRDPVDEAIGRGPLVDAHDTRANSPST